MRNVKLKLANWRYIAPGRKYDLSKADAALLDGEGVCIDCGDGNTARTVSIHLTHSRPLAEAGGVVRKSGRFVTVTLGGDRDGGR